MSGGGRFLAAFALLALLLAACGGGTDDPAEDGTVDDGDEAQDEEAEQTDDATDGDAVGEKTLTVALTNDLLTLFPWDETVVGAFDVFGNLFEFLIVVDEEGALEGRLATDWSSDDAVVWDVTIVDNATWHDGTPLTAADVAYSYNHLKENTDSARHGYVTQIDRAEAISDTEVRFTLTSPGADFPRQATLVPILPEGIAESMTPDEFSQNPIGSGPFRFVSASGGEEVVLEAYEDYRDGAPAIDVLRFVSVPSESARLTGLRSGELDVIRSVPPPEIASLEADDSVTVIAQPNNRVNYVAFNPEYSPMDDVRVRQAVDLAIDRDAITQQLLEGLGDPIGQVLAPATFGYSDDPTFAPSPYDPDRAAELLEEAGYAGEEVVLTYPTSDIPFSTAVSEAIGSYLQAIGMNVQLEAVEWGTMIERWRSTDFQHMHFFGFAPGTLDASLPVNSLFRSGSRGYFPSEEVDEILNRQAAEADPEARLSILEELWTLDQEGKWHAYLYNEYDAYAVRAGVEWMPRPSRQMYFWDADISR